MTSSRHSLAIAALTIALLLGIAGDLLIRGMPWGINVAIGTALFLAAVITLLVCGGRLDLPSVVFAVIPAFAAALGIAWRDSPVLVAVDALTLASFLSLLALGPRGVRVSPPAITDAALAFPIPVFQPLPAMLH